MVNRGTNGLIGKESNRGTNKWKFSTIVPVKRWGGWGQFHQPTCFLKSRWEVLLYHNKTENHDHS